MKHWRVLSAALVVALFCVLLLSRGGYIGQGASPDTLHVVRYDILPYNHLEPFTRTITDAAAVQQLYHTVLTLPVASAGTNQSCTADLGVRYDLAFSDHLGTLLHATVPTGGCGGLQIDFHRGRQPTDAFWSQLAVTLHMSTDDVFVLPVSDPHPRPTP